jgi:hypothetical protein
VPPVQVVVPQVVPLAYNWQAPVPLQKPLRWHVLAASAAHSLSGSVPVPIEPHVPSRPLPFLSVVHAWQVPVQAVSQQTPSAHDSPVLHCTLEVQAPPLSCTGWQVASDVLQ